MNDIHGERLHAPSQTFPGDISERSRDDTAPASDRWRSDLVRNGLIASLTEADVAGLRPLLAPAAFQAGQVLYSAGADVRDVYLLTEGLVGLNLPLADGASLTTTLVGPEGVVGLCPVMVGQPAVDSATVVVAGRGYRLSAQALRRFSADHATVAPSLARFLARQVTGLQTELACRAHHTVEQRLARLLLEACRTLGAGRLVITQEELATMLGVQRTTVSALAAKFKAAGALAYLRGAVRIADPQRLALAACDCFDMATSQGRNSTTAATDYHGARLGRP